MRRYTPLKPSRGTQIPPSVRERVLFRDRYQCVGLHLGWESHTNTVGLELDHVRGSGGLGMKSPSEETNLVVLCGSCHRWKTENGREARPLLLAYLDDQYRVPA